MKKILAILTIAICLMASANILETRIETEYSSELVREPKQLNEANFDEAINTGVVIVEFVASFAEPFADWEQVEKEGPYYRVDIEKYPNLKKKYKIRSIPTIIVFNNGSKELMYRANIMLELDVTASEIHQDIEDIFNDKF